MRPQTQIEISAQVWVCDACGSHDHKSCGCNSPAHMEKVLEKRAKDRERQRRHREKPNESNDPVTRDTVIDFPIELQPEASADQDVWCDEKPATIKKAFLDTTSRWIAMLSTYKKAFKVSGLYEDQSLKDEVDTAIDRLIIYAKSLRR